MSRPKMPALDRIKASAQFIGKGLVIDLPPAKIRTEFMRMGFFSYPVYRAVYDFTVWHELLSSPLNLEG